MRYDAMVYMPACLKNLQVLAHIFVHVRYAEGADVELEDLSVTAYSMNRYDLIHPNEDICALRLTLEVYGGSIVGEVNVLKVCILRYSLGISFSCHVCREPPSYPNAETASRA